MAILSGRYGEVAYTPSGGGASAVIASLNTWKASFATDYEDVTAFQDTNRVYVPGLMDVSGDFGGFWNSAELTLFEAAVAPLPGTLKLVPNSTEPDFYWTGLAYLDAAIDCSLAAPKVTGNFRAAGPWTGPDQGA
jgi:hypothetical protein